MPFPSTHHYSFIYHESVQIVLSCMWLLLLNVVCLRFTYIVVYVSNFIFIDDLYSNVWLYRNLFICSTVEGHLDYFQYLQLWNDHPQHSCIICSVDRSTPSCWVYAQEWNLCVTCRYTHSFTRCCQAFSQKSFTSYVFMNSVGEFNCSTFLPFGIVYLILPLWV